MNVLLVVASRGFRDIEYIVTRSFLEQEGLQVLVLSDAFELDRLCDFFEQNVKRLLHAEQKFTYHQPICAGDQITFVKTIREIFDKKNGQLEFVVSDNTLTNQHDILCVESQTTYVFRNA